MTWTGGLMIRSWILALVSLSLPTTGAESVALQGRGCVDDSGNEYTDRLLAKSIAKGQLAHELGSVVSANTTLETVTLEDERSIRTTEKITESVTLESTHTIERISTTESGYIVIGSDKKYCVTVSTN